MRYNQVPGALQSKLQEEFELNSNERDKFVILHIIVSGSVQRVFYRDSAVLKVKSLRNLTGWVRNLLSKQVEIHLETSRSNEGKKNAENFLNWCLKGVEAAREVGIESPLATNRKVDSIDITFSRSFEREYDSFKRVPTQR